MATKYKHDVIMENIVSNYIEKDVLNIVVQNIDNIDFTIQDKYGITIMHELFRRGYREVITFIINNKFGKSIYGMEIQDKCGYTPLMLAAGTGQYETVSTGFVHYGEYCNFCARTYEKNPKNIYDILKKRSHIDLEFSSDVFTDERRKRIKNLVEIIGLQCSLTEMFF